jgi:SAM-dependent methyltransferase
VANFSSPHDVSGDYERFAAYLLPGAQEFLLRLAIWPGIRMLDVGCGVGQVALRAARGGARVTGIDPSVNLVAQARQRVEAEGLAIRFDAGEAGALPYESGSFDLVVSLMGAMFDPRPERVAAELVRVCQPGGRIVMANWAPEGFVGRMLRTIGEHVPPANTSGPLKWGDEPTVRERLRDRVADLATTSRWYPLKYPFPPAEVVELFLTHFGPAEDAFATLDGKGRAALRADLVALWTRHNRAVNGRTEVDSEYLEVVAIVA